MTKIEVWITSKWKYFYYDVTFSDIFFVEKVEKSYTSHDIFN